MTNIVVEWEPGRQKMGVSWGYKGTPPTEPVHDLMHVLVGTMGLDWIPAGSREQTCRAEANAVYLEILLHCWFKSGCQRPMDLEGARCDESEMHINWFMGTHYAPFPCSGEEMRADFWRQALRYRHQWDAMADQYLEVLRKGRKFSLSMPLPS